MLPSDRYIASILGLTEDQYRHFQIEVRKRAADGPQPAVVAGVEIYLAAASLLIAVGSTAVSLLLKPSLPSQGQPGQPRQQQQAVDPVVRNDRFAPRYGFDSQQDIATIGSIIPIVYANRELISGDYYGGIRINMPMLWNQILSLGGGQMLRGVFLLGEGTVSSVDPNGFAIGSSTLQGYVFDSSSATEQAARATLYFSGNGGRISGSDRIAGRTNANDDGSSSSTDVFQVYWDGAPRTDFCSSSRPSNQTVFGVYSPIGNNLMYKVNPVLRPGVRSQLKPTSSDDVRVRCPADSQQMNQRDKFRAPFATFSGLNNEGITGDSATRTAAVGDTLTYKIFNQSHKDVVFDNYTEPNADNDDATAEDVASAVASLQRGWDDALVIGELYKIGSALAICTSRTADPFVSDVDLQSGGTGTTVTATFEVVRAGQVKEHKAAYLQDSAVVESGTLGNIPNREVGTTGGHIFRYVSARIAASRSCRAIEIGIKSTIGARMNGMCNFQQVKKYSTIDRDYCRAFENEQADEILNIFHQSGTITAPFERYSFFRIRWREYGSTSWNYLNNTYGTRSESQQALFAFIRLEFSSDKQPEVELEPLTGFEIRSSLDGGTSLYALDYKKGLITVSENGCTAAFNGQQVTRSSTSFGISESFGPSGLDDLYLYLKKTSDHTHAADIATTFSIASGETTANNVELDITWDAEGSVNIPLIIGGIFNVSVTGQRNGTVAFGDLLIGETYEILVIGDTNWAAIGGPASPVVGDTFAATADGTSEIGTTGEAAGLYVVTVNGTLTRTSGLPSDNSAFTFIANSSMPEATTFLAGTTMTVDGGNEYQIYKGLPKVDSNTYIDDYAKLAETFVYSEINSTAEGGTEHEIVYVNEIIVNATAPNYDNLALVGINIRSSAEFQQFSQFSAYVTGGKECTKLLGGSGATHLFPDVLYDLMTNATYGAGTLIKPYMINTAEFQAAAAWCQGRKYFYDAAIAEQINIRQWAADLAATHLLQFGEIDGKYFLRPALSFTAVPISGLFTAGNIAEGSFKLTYFDPEDREPIQVSVRYREERPGNDLTNPGLFPVVREVLVRESDAAGGSSGDRVEQLDMSAYCTSRNHAIDAAKFLIRMRRIPQHVITFKTMHDALVSRIAPGDYIKMAMDETEYDEFNNGAVTSQGALVSTKPLTDGTYAVVAWDGTEGSPPADATLTVSGGGTTATPTGIVFTVKLPSTQVRVYQVERIAPDDEGAFTIEAMHMPVNSSGILEVADGFDTAGNWTIQG